MVGEVEAKGAAGRVEVDRLTAKLQTLSVLAGEVADQLSGPDPLGHNATHHEQTCHGRPDPYEAMRDWEDLLTQTQAVLNQISAARTAAIAHYARYGTPDPRTPIDHHQPGYRDEYAGDQLAPTLELGTREADTLVDEAVWITTRTPRLLAEATAGHANLTTIAAIARELQDARPDTCETVEHAILARGLHHAPRTRARRSTRTLLTRHEAGAARRTRHRTRAQHTGVWLDPHPIPGLTLLTAALPTADAEALYTAIEHRATTTHRNTNPDGRTLGQHRATALTGLALHGVTLTTHLDILITQPAPNTPGTATAASAVTPAMALLPHTGAISADDVAAAITTWARHGAQVITTRSVLAPHSPAPAPASGKRAPANTYRPSTSLRHSVTRRDQHCRFPGCTRPARYTDLDHVTPWPHGPTTRSNLHSLCRKHHRAKHHRWKATITPTGDTTWTTPTGQTHLTQPGLTTDLADLTGPIRPG